MTNDHDRAGRPLEAEIRFLGLDAGSGPSVTELDAIKAAIAATFTDMDAAFCRLASGAPTRQVDDEPEQR